MADEAAAPAPRGNADGPHRNIHLLDDDFAKNVLMKDDVEELARRLDNGLSPNSEYASSGTLPEELGLPLLSYVVNWKSERCARFLLERGASVTRPDGFHKIAIQWAEEAGMTNIAALIERLNPETNLLAGLEFTNVIKRLSPPGSIVIPPTNVPMVVVCEDEKHFGKAIGEYVDSIPRSKDYLVLGVSTNGPYPMFEYQMWSWGRGGKVFGGRLSRLRGYYVITNVWDYNFCWR